MRSGQMLENKKLQLLVHCEPWPFWPWMDEWHYCFAGDELILAGKKFWWKQTGFLCQSCQRTAEWSDLKFQPCTESRPDISRASPWQPDICGVCSCDWPPPSLPWPRCRWNERGGYQTETGLWRALRSDTWTHSTAQSDGGCYHGDQSAVFLGALQVWCDWGNSRRGPNDVFHTSHHFLTPTLPNLSEAFLCFPEYD